MVSKSAVEPGRSTIRQSSRKHSGRNVIVFCCTALLMMLIALYFTYEARGDVVEVVNRIVYASPEDNDLHLTLFLPVSNKAQDSSSKDHLRPAVVMFHGGAWIAGTRHQLMWYGRELAKRGYVAASISYRMMPRYRFPEPVHDAKAAVRWMRVHADEYGIDPDRIAATGHSAGGHLAMMLGTTADWEAFEGKENAGVSSQVQAVISMYGAVDLTPYASPESWIRIGGVARQMMDFFVKEMEGKGMEPLVSASPITYIDAQSTPTLFIHGGNDNIVPVEVALNAHYKLRSAGVSSRFLLLPDQGHSFDHFQPVLRTMVFNEMLEFLEEHLGEGVK